MPERIFDAELRMRAVITLHKQAMVTSDNHLAFEYVKALEEVARAAKTYYVNSTPSNAVHLNDALQKVDWMKEK